MAQPVHNNKSALRSFLARNPFGGPFTDGLFFRDKMRAIHEIAPDEPVSRLLEIGGGQSGLSALLYANAWVVNLDMDERFARSHCNRQPNVSFCTADATNLPFANASFDMVTMFDLLEHVQDDSRAANEAMRVLRPGGWLLISTPERLRWRYPYYRIFKPICPREEELFKEWGHVRRGYTIDELNFLLGMPAARGTSFINALLALSHDVSFSRVAKPWRLMLHGLLAPASLLGWFAHRKLGAGTEIAAAWQKPSE